MSLLRLLTTGKSLVGVNDNEGRYRLTSKRLLPQFGSAKNPFRPKAKSHPGPAELDLAGGNGGDNPRGDKCNIVPVDGKPILALHPSSERRALPTAAGRTPLAAPFWSKFAALLGRWRAKLSRGPEHQSGKAAKSAIPRFAKPPTQQDLSLDTIKVVRNDLREADLEVTPARHTAGPAEAAPQSQVAKFQQVMDDTRKAEPTPMLGPSRT